MGAGVDDVTGACVGGVTGAWAELSSSDVEVLGETCDHEIPLGQSATVTHASIANNILTGDRFIIQAESNFKFQATALALVFV